MGIERNHLPDYFRKKAEQFRTKADRRDDMTTKLALRGAAQSYDDLARLAEQIRTVQDAAE